MNGGLSLVRILEDTAPEAEWSTSPSAVVVWLECGRKWGFRYIAKLYAPPAPSALLGTDGHAQAEAFLGEGTPLDFSRESGAVMQAGQYLWPAPKTPGMVLERKFRFQSTRTGFVYSGLKDIEIAPCVPQPQLGFDGFAPIVIDHKTTSSIEKYAKSVDDLLYDPQASIYGLDAMARFESPVVDLAWIYYQTKGAKRAKPVTLRVELNHTLKCFDAIETVAKEMAQARKNFESSDLKEAPLTFVKKTLKANPAACGAYGGCPYQHICNLSPAERMRSALSMSLIANLRNRVQGTDASTTNGPAPQEDKPAPPPASEPVQTEIPPALMTPYRTPEERAADARAQAHVADPINPPESQLPPPSLAPTPPPAAPESPPLETATATKRGRGRPAGSKNKAKDEPVPPATLPDVYVSNGADVAAAQDACERMAPLPPKVQEALDKCFHLYVDCLPDGGNFVTYADVLVAKANARIVSGGQVAHYKFLKFGEAAGALAIALGEVLDEEKPQAVFVNATSEALPILTARAAVITRSVR